MAISFVGSATAASTSGATLTLTLPAMQQGDCVLAILQSRQKTGYAATSSSGGPYTQLNTPSSLSFIPAAFLSIMSSSPDTQTLCSSGASSGAGNTAIAMVFRAVESSFPEDAPLTSAGAASGTPDSPSITVNSANDAIITAVSAFPVVPVTAPSSYLNTTSTTAIGSASTAQVAAAWITHTGSSAFNPAAWGSTGSISAWGAITIALREQTVSVTWSDMFITGGTEYQYHKITGY